MRFRLLQHSSSTLINQKLISFQSNHNFSIKPQSISIDLNNPDLDTHPHHLNADSQGVNHTLPLDSKSTRRPNKLGKQVQITTFIGSSFSDSSQPLNFSSQPLEPPNRSNSALLQHQNLSNLLKSIRNQDFQAAIQSFNGLCNAKKSQLSPQIYDSLFSLASQVFPDDKIFGSTHHQSQFQIDELSPALLSAESASEQSYRIDYCKVQDRLLKIDQLFQSIQRPLSTQQLHLFLHIAILAASIRLRRFYLSSSSPPDPCDDQSRNSLFLQSCEYISSVVQRLPALRQLSTPTADQLAEAIPFEILGLYSRFLVVFHQPNQGLKLIRKIYYAYLIALRHKSMSAGHQQLPKDIIDSVHSSVTSVIQVGSLIISLLHHKTHHRLAALKLAVRMITIGGVYPDQLHMASLLRRMYMSKPEWDSVIEFQTQLTDQSTAQWLQNQIAIVEAEDGRVERVLRLSAETLKLAGRLQGDFLAPSTLSLDIFAHAIQALADNPELQGFGLSSGLRGALAIRTRMIELGILPPPESDDVILRRIYHVAQRVPTSLSRHEFLKEMIGAMFPTNKIVPIRSESLRSFKFASHPGKSPEAFRLMKWLMNWNELDLSLQVFQSISRYGYVTSFTSIPLSYLKRLLRRALYCHPELAMELYQHLHMSGCDCSGELFEAVKSKAIHMGDYHLAGYLLKMSEDNDPVQHTSRIMEFMSGFAARRATPGNVLKTLSLLDFVGNRWSDLINIDVWNFVLQQIKRFGPIKLSQRPELKPRIDNVIERLNHAELADSERIRIQANLVEFLEVTKLIELHNDSSTDQKLETSEEFASKPRDIIPAHQKEEQGFETQGDSKLVDDHLDHSPGRFEDLIIKSLGENQVLKSVDIVKVAIKLDYIIPGPIIGRILNRLIDEFDQDEKIDQTTDNERLDRSKQIRMIVKLNQAWRSMAWKFKVDERGDDSYVVEAMERLYNHYQISETE